MIGFLSKIFGGSKSDKDVKLLTPRVAEINNIYEQLKALSNDELRNKTQEFRNRISEALNDIQKEIESKRAEATNNPDAELQDRESIYLEVDKLIKKKDEQLETILDELLPEAFAVIKETSRRFSENKELEATATELDKDFAVEKDHIRIEGDKVIYNNSWDAAGSTVTWNMVHYDVQLVGGMVLHQGKIAEMATGEGKTLVSTLPAYLNALAGEGVHIVTVNDYLARRDQEWNSPIFEFLGLRTDCIDKHQPSSEERKDAYKADIIYGTNNEFGFDYLRDNMVHSPDEMVQRKHHYAMVDEVDSVLIDDARTPLIIAGPIPRSDEHQFHQLKPRIQKLVDAQRKVINANLTEAKKLIAEGKTDKEAGGLHLYRAHRGLPKTNALIKFLSEEGNRQILQKTENYYLGEQQRHMPKVDEDLLFTIDEKGNSVDLTNKGIALITTSGEDPEFFILPDIGSELAEIEKKDVTPEEKAKLKDQLLQDYAIKSERIHSIQQLLKAYTLFEKDDEYVVMDGKVKIVDEQTGRIMEGRRYSDGLHQAIEAKEDVQVEAATQTHATVTLQNYFRMYHKLAGMTGTAETEAGELWEIYKLDVVGIPTNVPIARNDQQDLVYKTKREKYKAVIDEVEALRAVGRPILVGTTSVEISELLGRMLQQKKIPHQVLNAKQHASEATVVAEAGKASAVTIATNMAGRGTDIKLGEGVKEAGGLAIIGTERHESRRVDRQLRGRAGRQGDPGSSQFFVSLEDDLMRLFQSDRIAGMMDKMGHKEGEVLQHSMITKSIERAQKKVEENNFGIRKRLLEYDDVMNSQRDVIYKRRRHGLFGDRLSIDLDNAMYDVCTDIALQAEEERNFETFKLEAMKHLAVEPNFISAQDFDKADLNQVGDDLYHQVKDAYTRKCNSIAEVVLPTLQKVKADSGDRIENIVIPFTDGLKGLQVYTNLDEAVEGGAKPVIQSLEKAITLSLIDESWKDHLRAMDDLRTSVQMASYEQKDPLLIYKFEAFNLFKQMLLETNRNIVSFLLRANIPMEEAPQQATEAPQQTDMSKMRMNKQEIDEAGQSYAADENDVYDSGEPVQRTPVQAGPKIGRNDPCPCGSGKKYKQCHGK